MHVITARNVNDAFAKGMEFLAQVGIKRDSRNGPVLIAPSPVTTVYERPLERVLIHPERDANPFFHLYESLWMLAGRNDVASVARYAKQMNEYSDDGQTLHGAYGYRWRYAPGFDQLNLIAEALKKNPDDRRQVLQMWNASSDLGRTGKDVPCNTIASFQINTYGALDLTVFCRSNDIIWGAYGANAVHFSFLLEYMALRIGVPVGRMYQVSVNWHGYLEVFEPLMASLQSTMHRTPAIDYDYVKPLQLEGSDSEVDNLILSILQAADHGIFADVSWKYEWAYVTHRILHAHHIWKTKPAPERYEDALTLLGQLDIRIDFVAAAISWIARRAAKWSEKMASNV